MQGRSPTLEGRQDPDAGRRDLGQRLAQLPRGGDRFHGIRTLCMRPTSCLPDQTAFGSDKVAGSRRPLPHGLRKRPRVSASLPSWNECAMAGAATRCSRSAMTMRN
jgi:hypothetical protein